MFWFITKIMMIFLGLCATFYTFETSGLFHFISSNSVTYRIMCSYSFWMIISILSYTIFTYYLTINTIFIFLVRYFMFNGYLFVVAKPIFKSFCFMIFSLVIYDFFFVQSVVFGVIFFAFFFAFWCFVKFCLKHYSTFFAITRKTIISRFVFVKFQNWLNFFTFRTLFFIHKNNNNIRVGICQ